MLLSQLFLPLLKEQPIESQIVSHTLMLRSGMIRQQCSGIYSWLPMGLRVLKNIENIVRFNMNSAGCQEVLMPCVQPADLWIESGRYEAYGKEMLQFLDRHENRLIFGPTNEEMITDIFRSNVQSYRDLPKNLYQIQWKFRDEIRPRFGVMRGREFLMKDAYSFDIDKESAMNSYDLMYVAYMSTFRDLGVSAIPVLADSGPIGGDMNHEFHIIASTGESTIYYDKEFEILGENLSENISLLRSLYAAADEKHDPVNCPLKDDELLTSKSIEVGHIFYFGTKYSKAMKALINNKDSSLVPAEMCSYGIGISRLVAAIIEANHDERGIIWPASVAPFKVSVINLNISDPTCTDLALQVYNSLLHHGLEVLYDDTDERAGSKFASHDLIGSPWQVIIGPKKAKELVVELKHRRTGEIQDLPAEAAARYIAGHLNVK